jgi:hypothetical protein
MSDWKVKTKIHEAEQKKYKIFKPRNVKNRAEDTPQTIFPHRKIGHLREGYETGFLVLSGNPLDNFERIKNIQLRFKQGYLINIK